MLDDAPVPRTPRELGMTPALRAAQRAHRRAHTSQLKAADDVVAMKAAVRAARDAGHSLEEIGKALGVTKQRIHSMLNP